MNDAQHRHPLIGPVLVLATLVSSVISSFGAPLISTVAQDFAVSLSTAQWSLTVALLVGAVGSPVLGRLGDGARRRTVLLAGLAAVTLGGVLAAIAKDYWLLLLGRGLHGVGLGLAPLAMAIARDVLPPDRVGPMVALLSVSAGAGLGAGYPISGWLAGAWGLPGAYGFGAVVSGIALVCVAAVVPSGVTGRSSDRLDWIEVVLLAAALVGAMVAAAEGTAWGWTSPAIIGLALAAAVIFAAWAVHQLRVTSPLVQLRLLRHRAVLSGDVCALALGVAMYMVLTGVAEFVQSPRSGGFGFSASTVVAGSVLMPLSILMLISSRLLPAVVARIGSRAVLMLGCLVAASGSGFFAVFHDHLWQVLVTTGVLGVGLGITFAAIPGMIVRAVPVQETGSALGFYQVVRFTGFSLGSALTATILAGHPDSRGQPTADGFALLFWAAAGVGVLAGVLARVAHST